ncbi:MAG: hypothetical protein Q8Q07_03285 [Dehalococcoidales bacterium]|nr:hypothetical protein [Dehalococcoidales bacterium]
MAILAWVLASLGGLSAVMGVITAAGVLPPLGDEFTTMFWLTLGIILLLGCVAAASASQSSYD